MIELTATEGNTAKDMELKFAPYNRDVVQSKGNKEIQFKTLKRIISRREARRKNRILWTSFYGSVVMAILCLLSMDTSLLFGIPAILCMIYIWLFELANGDRVS